MRTTVTLDNDVERLLREEMHRSRSGFKETLNAAIRTGLSRKSAQTKRPRFIIQARPMGLRPGLAHASLNKLADELEVEAFLAKTPHHKAKRRVNHAQRQDAREYPQMAQMSADEEGRDLTRRKPNGSGFRLRWHGGDHIISANR